MVIYAVTSITYQSGIFLIFLLTQENNTWSNNWNHYKKNLIYKLLVLIGIYVLKSRKRKLLFSHDQFKGFFVSKNKNFFNFLFYKFKINNKKTNKKFDLVFYLKNNRNKGNNFLKNLIRSVSHRCN